MDSIQLNCEEMLRELNSTYENGDSQRQLSLALNMIEMALVAMERIPSTMDEQPDSEELLLAVEQIIPVKTLLGHFVRGMVDETAH